MTDPVIPPAAIEATSEARYAHRDASGPHGAVKCRCGQSFRTGVEQLQHASHAILAAALPHLRPLVAPVCDCYPGGFSPETYEGPQHHCPVHGHGNDLPTSECPVCLDERALTEYAMELGRTLGRAEGRKELLAELVSRCEHRLTYTANHGRRLELQDMLSDLRDIAKGDSV